MQVPEIAAKCKKIVSEMPDDWEYQLACISVDDVSFEEFKHKPAPKKPQVVADIEAMDYAKRTAHLKNMPGFWSDPNSPAFKYMKELQYNNETNEGHKYYLNFYKKLFVKNRDEHRWKKVKAALDGFPVQVSFENDDNVKRALNTVGGTLLTKKVFGYDD